MRFLLFVNIDPDPQHNTTHDTQIIEGLEKENVDGKRLLEAHNARKRADRAELLGLKILVRHSRCLFLNATAH